MAIARPLEQYRLSGIQETGRELGRGAWGSVEELVYRGCLCAGKQIYSVLVEQEGPGQSLTRRWLEECSLHSQLLHPNIVQFLGIYQPSRLPVLVTEYLPTTLSSCLDANGRLPEEMCYSLFRDVALGLNYLHQRPAPIIHCDLTATTVMLTGSLRAKITDFGVCEILEPGRYMDLPRCPGTLAYMPPEAFLDRPLFDTKLDMFSYGVVMVHTLCAQCPLPTASFCSDPSKPDVLIAVSEADRRAEYLDRIGRSHPLMDLILQCLSRDPHHRPTAVEALTQVARQAEAAGYAQQEVQVLTLMRDQDRRLEQLQIENAEIKETLHRTSVQMRLMITGVEDVNADSFRGADIIGKTKFTVTNKGGSFDWNGYGLKLHVPRDSLPAGLDSCDITVKASLSGQFEFPEDSEPVSPTFWITAPGKFLRPITVEIQHCVITEDGTPPPLLTFTTANCTQTDLPYEFKPLDGGAFSTHSSYGSIAVRHFSAFTATAKKGCDKRYCAQVFTTAKSGMEWRVFFVITKNLNAALTVVKHYYGQFELYDQASLRIRFQRSEITLDIPEEGHVKNGWRITPRSHPSISRTEADHFKAGQWIPECELIVTWEEKQKSAFYLRRKINLLGARSPNNFFHLIINPDWEVIPSLAQSQFSPDAGQHKKRSLSEGTQSTSPLPTVLTHRDLMNEVGAVIPAKWRFVGNELELQHDQLDAIEREQNGTLALCFSAVFHKWECDMTSPYTWQTIITVLKAPQVGARRLANTLEDRLQ